MLTRTIAPTSEPLSIDDAKEHLRAWNSSEDDSQINNCLAAAREYYEKIANRALITQTWTLKLDGFWGSGWCHAQQGSVYSPDGWSWNNGTLEIYKCPVQSVTSIQYVDTAGSTQTLSTSLYQTDLTSEPARIRPAYGQCWPATRPQMNAVTVTFVAGYGASDSAVPQDTKHCLRLLLTHFYNERAIVTEQGRNAAMVVPFAIESLLACQRVY